MADALTQDQITAALNELDGWEFENDMITKTYKFDSYVAGLAFATTAGTLAEARDHHPDMAIGWRKVTVSFTTHDAGSKVTQKDIDLAQAIESVGFPG
jgi:4a-hydroxytetrahydrobiopterin dehydratase